jgi:hypothetical protein
METVELPDPEPDAGARDDHRDRDEDDVTLAHGHRRRIATRATVPADDEADPPRALLAGADPAERVAGRGGDVRVTRRCRARSGTPS